MMKNTQTRPEKKVYYWVIKLKQITYNKCLLTALDIKTKKYAYLCLTYEN